MLQSDFVHRHAWMKGLHEYYAGTEYEADYELLYKSLYHDNAYRRRDLLLRIHEKVPAGELWSGERTLKSFYNTIIHKDMPEYDVKERLLIGLISMFIGDKYTARLYDLMTYFESEAAAPDMNDFFSRGQVKSKKWLIEELSKVVDGRQLGNVVMYGAWYNFLAHMLFENFEIERLHSVDIDDSVREPADRMYKDYVSNGSFRSFTADVSRLTWQIIEDTDVLFYVDNEKYTEDFKKYMDKNYEKIKQNIVNIEDVKHSFGHKQLGPADIIINTSCEHMDNRWFHNIPDGTLVCLQTNDYFDNPQHINCVMDEYQAMSRYPMSKFYYAGRLDTELYNRFMLIGVK
jgi:hypothetical protein